MKRRDFIKNGAGLFLAAETVTLIGSSAFGAQPDSTTRESDLAELRKRQIDNQCHSLEYDSEWEKTQIESLRKEDPNGIIAISQACRSPHRHFVHIPSTFLDIENVKRHLSQMSPQLRATIEKTGLKFPTSHAYNRSTSIRSIDVLKLVPSGHQHDLVLSLQDLEEICTNAEGKEIVMMQINPTSLTGAIELGHIFHLKKPVS